MYGTRTYAGLIVNSQNLLWHTRGRYWDYEFVCIPEDPELSSWWLVLQEVLRGTESNTEAIFRYGMLPLSPPRSFFAAAYQDPTLQDAFDRPQIQERSNRSNGLGAYFCAYIQHASCKLRVAPPSSPK